MLDLGGIDSPETLIHPVEPDCYLHSPQSREVEYECSNSSGGDNLS